MKRNVTKRLKLIKIDWEQLPWIMDGEEALKPDVAGPFLPEMTPDNNLRRETELTWGNIDEGFRQAEQITEFKVEHDEMSWAGTEAMVAVASGKATIWNAGFTVRTPSKAASKP